MNRHSFIFYGPSESGKTIFIKDFCYLYSLVNLFCIDKNEWRRCIVYCIYNLDLLDEISNFANSLIIFDEMGSNIRLPVLHSLYSTGRHLNTDLINIGQTLTELNTKAKEYTPMVYITLNSSQQFFERVQKKLKIESNLYRFKHLKYAIKNMTH